MEKSSSISKPINKEKAKLAVNKAYDLLNKSQPNILFFTTLYDLLKYIYDRLC